MPTSVFLKNSTIFLIFSTQKYLPEKDNPEWSRNFSSIYVSNAEKWFTNDTWKVQFQTKTDHSTADCQAKPPGYMDHYNIAVLCNVEQSGNDFE